MEALHELFGDDRPAPKKHRDGPKSKKYLHRRRPSKELIASNMAPSTMASVFIMRHCSPVPNSSEDFPKRYEAGYFDDSSAGATETTTASLPPEPALGNIEYKLKLVNPTRHRFEHLVTQVRIHLLLRLILLKECTQ